MNNREISRIINTHHLLRNIFVGVYPADCLPDIPRKNKPCAYIANTHRKNQPGEHWVCFYATSYQPMEYFDSYGFPPKDDFLNILGEDYLRSTKFVQHPLSAMCGQYCIFYIYMRAIGTSMIDIIQMFDDNTLLNDVKVNRIIEEVFDVDLDVFDLNYIGKQIAHSFSQEISRGENFYC